MSYRYLNENRKPLTNVFAGNILEPNEEMERRLILEQPVLSMVDLEVRFGRSTIATCQMRRIDAVLSITTYLRSPSLVFFSEPENTTITHTNTMRLSAETRSCVL